MLWMQDRTRVMEEASRLWQIKLAASELISQHSHLPDEGDLHLCGFCKQSFKRLDQWLEHKQLQWCKASYHRLSRSLSLQHRDMVARASASLQDNAGEVHRPYRLSSEDLSESTEVSAATSRPGDGVSLGTDSLFSAPVKRTSYPIPIFKKRERGERARTRKQESPQPLAKLEKSSPTSSFTAESVVPISPASEDRDGLDSSLFKRRRVSPPSASTSAPNPSLPPPCPTGPLFSPDQPSVADITGHSRRPLVLPRVYSCPRCSKSFIKLSHLHRHMNKKKPCEAKDTGDAIDDSSETEEIMSMPSEVSFTCGLCSEHYTSYDDIINHHSEKHPAYYPGYCRFCGKFQDRKNKLLIHLVKHDHSQIVDEVAQEVKRIRQIKIDKPPPASQLPLPTSSSIYGLPNNASSVNPNAPATPGTPVELFCPCCKTKYSDRDELVCHFQDYHLPVGCHVSDAEILDLAVEEVKVEGGAESLSCFICCLTFQSRESLEQHLDLHKVWSEKVEPTLVNGSAQPETPAKVDENRNTSKTPNNEAVVESQTNNNNNSEHVMDLSVSSKRFDRSPLLSVPSVESNGSPEETVPLDYPCWLCTDQNSSLESWREHINVTHKIPLIFRCVREDCRKEFQNWTDLYEHSTEHSQKAFVCKVCNDHQPSPQLLANHSQCHSRTKSIAAVCSYCQCLVSENMELHRIQCSRQEINCPECNEKVKRLALLKHMISHSSRSGKSYKCDHCDSTFPIKDRLTQHMKNVHGPRKFVCTDCGAAFKRNDKLQRHCQSRHSDLKPYLCPIVSCGRAFKRIDGLRAHVKCSHVSEALAHLVKNHYGCTVCGKLVSGQEKLVDHLMSHVKATPPSVMSSSLSGELFGSADPGNESRTGSTQVPQYECPHCHIKVPNETLFYAHLVQHSQLAAFQSPVLPFRPGSFFFPLGHNTTAPGSNTE